MLRKNLLILLYLLEHLSEVGFYYYYLSKNNMIKYKTQLCYCLLLFALLISYHY